MPSGFTKDPNYGLGLDRNLSFVVHALAKVDGIQKLRLSNERTLDVAVADNGATYEMGYTLFGTLRRNANRFDDKARASSRKKKHQAAYTNLLTKLDGEKFPLKLFERAT